MPSIHKPDQRAADSCSREASASNVRCPGATTALQPLAPASIDPQDPRIDPVVVGRTLQTFKTSKPPCAVRIPSKHRRARTIEMNSEYCSTGKLCLFKVRNCAGKLWSACRQRSNFKGSGLRCINEKIQISLMHRAQFDEICLFMHTRT